MIVLPFDFIFDHIPGDGWLSRPEAELLWRVASETTGPILEVGCHRGRSTCLLGALGRPVYAVDPFDGTFHGEGANSDYSTLLKNLDSRRLSNVEVFRQKIEDWTPLRAGFCYLDGDHTYQGTVSQIKKALLCDPAVVAMHDVTDGHSAGKEVTRAALRFLGPWDVRVERMAVWTITDIIKAMEQA